MAVPDSADSTRVPLRANPYVGPLAFQRRDAPRFFGRDDEAEELQALVISERVVLFYAQSGAGKTSLINARLVPDLKQEGFSVLPVARVGVEEPETHTVDNIYVFNALSYLSGRKAGDARELASATVRDFLATGDAAASEEVMPPVLIIDQFEEILTAYPERWQEREGFFDQLRQALREDPMLSLLLVMREDHIAGLDRYADILPGGLHARFRMERLRHEAAIEAVRRPVADLRPFAAGVAEQLVNNLRQEHLADQETKIAGEFVEPVQLQVVCYQLWQGLRGESGGEITETHLQAFGNVDRALEDFYESAVAGVAARTAAPEARIRRWFGATLITPSRIRSQVNRGVAESGGLINDAVDELVDAHLIRAEQVRGGTWFELVHDRFIDPILVSNRRWFGSAARRRLAIAAVAVVMLAVLGLSWNRLRVREARLAQAEQVSQLALDTLNDHPPRSLWLALQAAKLTRTVTRQLTPRTRDALRQALQASRVQLVRYLPIGDTGHQLFLDGNGDRLGMLDPAGRASVLDIESGQELFALGEESPSVAAMALSPDGTTLAAALADGALQLWGIDSQQLRHTFFPELEVFELLFSQNGARVAATSFEGILKYWDANTGHSIGSLLDSEGSIVAGAFGPEGQRLATATDTGTLAIWDLESGRRLHAFPGEENSVLAFGPAGLASGGSEGIHLWDAATGMLPDRLLALKRRVYSLAFSSDRYVVFALDDGSLRIWDLDTNRLQDVDIGDEELSSQLALSQTGRRLVVAREKGKTEIWALIFEELSRVMVGHEGKINATAIGRQGGLLASGSDDRTARVWDVESGRLLETLREHQAPVSDVAFSPDGRRLATASDDRNARIWNLESGRLERTLAGHSNTVEAVAWRPDGASIATASTDGTVRLWNVADGSLQETLDHPEENVLDLAFSPDGTLLATAGGLPEEEVGIARLWDARSGAEIARLDGHSDLVNAVAFSPDGELLATGSDDRTARIWDPESSRLLQTLSGHTGSVAGATFAPEGTRLATCDVNGTIILWDTDSGEESISIPGSSEIFDLVFTADGRRLVTGGGDAMIRFEPFDAEDLIGLAEQRTGAEPVLKVEN